MIELILKVGSARKSGSVSVSLKTALSRENISRRDIQLSKRIYKQPVSMRIKQ